MLAEVSDAKRQLRTLVRSRRAAWPPERRRDASAQLGDHLVRLCRLDGTVMTYLAFGSEADLSPVIAATRAGGGRIVVPRVEDRAIVPVELVEDATLVTSAYGIDEPLGTAIPADEIDVVLVPGVAFDRSGGRLGNGAGYYDRFLPRLRPGTPTVGVCFSVQLVDAVPLEPWDVRLGLVVSERGVEGGTTLAVR